MHYSSRTKIIRRRGSSFLSASRILRAQLEPAEQKFRALFEKYNGKTIADDTHEFSKTTSDCPADRKSFPNTGIEPCSHNLADPSHSLIVLENNATGRHFRDGTTNLLIDLRSVSS
jgi:hypothetical protein